MDENFKERATRILTEYVRLPQGTPRGNAELTASSRAQNTPGYL